MSIIAVYSGVGKINAAIATQALIDHFAVDIVIVSGLAGGMNADVKIFDTVVCTNAIFHDSNNEILTEYHPWMKKPCFYADEDLIQCAKRVVDAVPQKVHFGLTTTGDIYVNLDKSVALCIEMETAAIAQVCYVNSTPFIGIRSISDTSNENGEKVINSNFDKAANYSYLLTVEIMKEYSLNTRHT